MKKFLSLLVLTFTTSCIFATDAIPLKRGAQGKLGASGQGEPSAGAPHQHGEEGEDAHIAPRDAKPYIASISAFGSPRITEATLKKTLGKDLDAWLEKGMKGDSRAKEIGDTLAAKIKNKFGLHSAEWSVIQIFEPTRIAIHVTLDAVEKKDVEARMPFHKEPTGEFKDPDHLIQDWMEYEGTALELINAGLLEPEVEKCTDVSFHCPFGHKHEKLAKFEKPFVNGVKKHFNKLTEIIANDKRPEFRGAAVFLTPYHKDGQKVVDTLVAAVKDPHELVRNNALRVLGDFAEKYSQFTIPPAPVIAALNYPRVTDRSKAVFVVEQMALHSPLAAEQILKTGVPNLMALMASSMPDQKEMAHVTLKKISGQEFTVKDMAAWNKWFKQFTKDREVSGKK